MLCSFALFPFPLEPSSNHHRSTGSGFMKATGEPYSVKPMPLLRLTQRAAFDVTDHALLRDSQPALGFGTSLLIPLLCDGHPSLSLLLHPPYLLRTNFSCPWHLIFRLLFFSKVTSLLIVSTTGVLHDPQIIYLTRLCFNSRLISNYMPTISTYAP